MKELNNKIGIYMIQNKETGDCYVGSSKQFNRRIRDHFAKLQKGAHENPYIQNSYNKYGLENFSYSILEFCELEKLREREQHYVDKLDPKFNIIKEVERHSLPESSRQMISNTLKEGYESGRVVSSSFKKVSQYDLNGNFIKEFQSVNSAAEDTNIHVSTLIRCLNGTHGTAGGYIWRYENDTTPIQATRRKKERAIIFEDKDTGDKQQFRSYKEAAEHFSTKPGTFQQYVLRKIYFQKKYLVYHAPS